MAIDVGYNFSDSGDIDNGSAAYSIIDNTNPANASGTITQADFWANTTGVTGFKIFVAYPDTSAPTFTGRSAVTLGNFTGDAKQTITGLSMSVSTGDYAGWYRSNGAIRAQTVGGAIRYYVEGDKTLSTASYNKSSHYFDLLYLTGTETAVGQPLKNVFGRPFRGCFR
jgi:hypothetical protein